MDNYAWVILHDYIGHGEEDGVAGPFGRTMKKKRIVHDGVMFKMYDDDGILYYTGYIAGEYEGFEPLDDFGMPNAGCMDIRYKGRDGAWESL